MFIDTELRMCIYNDVNLLIKYICHKIKYPYIYSDNRSLNIAFMCQAFWWSK